MREIKSLTALRMIAALTVFFHHYNCVNECRRSPYPLVAHNIGQSIVVEGHVGVIIFFVLSGFLITLRYYEEVAERRFASGLYFQRRIARIYPLYFYILLITLGTMGKPLEPTSIVNWTLTQGFFADLKVSGIPTAWSLTVEESFYLLAPVVFLSICRVRLRFALAALALWTVGLFLLGLLIQATTLDTWGFMHDTLFMFGSTLFGMFFHFGFGIAAALLYLNGWKPQRSATSLAVLALIGTALALDQMNRVGGFEGGWYLSLPVGFFAALLILALTQEQSVFAHLLSFRPLVYLGRISYAVYLIQITPPFVILATLFLEHNAVIPLYLVANLVGILLYEVIEKPGQRLIMRLGGAHSGA